MNELAEPISSIALTMENFQAIPNLWQKVRDGEFKIVYATPETLLQASGYFLKDIVPSLQSAFMRNLVAVAIDECHLMWDWIGFREKYGDIGPLRSAMPQVPFLGLSATLTPNVAAYVHRVSRLACPTHTIDISTRRDNINILVARMDGNSIEPLLNRVPKSDAIQSLADIPKTLIFHDGVNQGIDISNQLMARLPSVVDTIPSSVIVASYYGDLDSLSKSTILDNIKKGSTRIVICTDAFGLGIDVDDIDVVIQWGVCERLMGSTLSQRIGRAARDPRRTAIAVVYVQSYILDYIAREGEPENWREAWDELSGRKEVVDSHAGAAHIPPEDQQSGLGVVPLGAQLDLKKFGLPVSPDTTGEVSLHLRTLYRDVKTLREVYGEAKKAMQGTKQVPLPMVKKLDPPVLWFICTTGCRHMMLGSVFQDTNLFQRSHRDWCCDQCLYLKHYQSPEVTLHGISSTISVCNPQPPAPAKRQIKRNTGTLPDRHRKPDTRLESILRTRLTQVRYNIWARLAIPNTGPCIVFPDGILERIIISVSKVGSPPDLVNVLLIAGVDVQLSLLEDEHIEALSMVIQHTMLQTLPPVHIVPRLMPAARTVPSLGMAMAEVTGSPELFGRYPSLMFKLMVGISGSGSDQGESDVRVSGIGATGMESSLPTEGRRDRDALTEITDNGQLSKRPRRLKKLPWRIRNEG
jgi:hypothetical protein